jgi:type I restriction enzyme S subunit
MERTKVKNLAKQIRGVSYKPEDLHDSLDEDSVILLRANNIDEGKINFDDVVYVDKSKVSDEQYLKVGDVLICASSGSKQLVGKAASVDFDSPCTFGAFCKVVRPNNNVADYLGKYFQSGVYRRKISEVAIGANINNIRNEHIDSLELPIYEPAQTHRIVEKIGLLQIIIDNRKCELSKLDELIKARFVEMFGDPVSDTKDWGQKPLKEMLESIRYGTSSPPEFSDEGYAFIRATNIKNGHIVDNDMRFIPQHEADRLEKCKLLGGEIIIVRSGVNAGDTCVVTPEYSGQYAGYDMILVLNESLNPVFLNTLINTTYMEKVVKPMTRRAAQPHLNSEQTQSFPIICVPREQQDQFATFVKQVDKSKVAVQKALDEAQKLFDSLMQEYFG